MPSMDVPTGPPPRLQLLLHSLCIAAHVPTHSHMDSSWCPSPSCAPLGLCSWHTNVSTRHSSRLKSSCFPHVLTHLHLDSSWHSSPSCALPGSHSRHTNMSTGHPSRLKLHYCFLCMPTSSHWNTAHDAQVCPHARGSHGWHVMTSGSIQGEQTHTGASIAHSRQLRHDPGFSKWISHMQCRSTAM